SKKLVAHFARTNFFEPNGGLYCMRNFRTFNLAVEFNRSCRSLRLNRSLRDQLDRAAQSIALNLAEGRGRSSLKDQKRFFAIAFASARECQAILMLADLEKTQAAALLDNVIAHIYRLRQHAS